MEIITQITPKQQDTPKAWYGCYDGGWQGLISENAFSHPAKFSRNLISRIYTYALEQGYLKPGDTVLDCFGGVGLGALDAGASGLNWVGVELEKKFHDLGQGCDCTGISALEWKVYSDQLKPDTISQLSYDTRHWCPACIAGALQIKANGLSGHRQPGLFDAADDRHLPVPFKLTDDGTPYSLPHHYIGNLELFRKYAQPGTFAVLLNGDSRELRGVIGRGVAEGLLSSPPYEGSIDHAPGNKNWTGGKPGNIKQTDYGQATGQLGAMKPGNLDALLSSPPYTHPAKTGETKEDSWSDGRSRPVGASQRNNNGYGHTDGQLGEMATGNLADGLLSSPPFAGNTGGRGEASRNGIDAALFDRHSGGMKRGTGDNPANLDHLPMRGLGDALVSSPPYVNVDPAKSGKGVDLQKNYETYRASGGGQSFEAYCRTQATHSQGYGHSNGQLSGLPSGSFDAALSSPPFEGSLNDGLSEGDRLKYKELTRCGRGIGTNYGQTTGQLGTEQGQTFWQAAHQILAESYLALKPGSYTFWVTKRFVRDGAIVDFTDQWRQLCESCGFEFVEHIKAMLIQSESEQGNLNGDIVRHKKKKASFFRRLHEKKFPHLAIDHEDVLIMRKPATNGNGR